MPLLDVIIRIKNGQFFFFNYITGFCPSRTNLWRSLMIMMMMMPACLLTDEISLRVAHVLA